LEAQVHRKDIEFFFETEKIMDLVYELNIGSDLPESSSHVEFLGKDEDTDVTLYACTPTYIYIYIIYTCISYIHIHIMYIHIYITQTQLTNALANALQSPRGCQVERQSSSTSRDEDSRP